MIRATFQESITAILAHHNALSVEYVLGIVPGDSAERKRVCSSFCRDPAMAGEYADHVSAGGRDALYYVLCVDEISPYGYIWTWHHRGGYATKVISSY